MLHPGFLEAYIFTGTSADWPPLPVLRQDYKFCELESSFMLERINMKKFGQVFLWKYSAIRRVHYTYCCTVSAHNSMTERALSWLRPAHLGNCHRWTNPPGYRVQPAVKSAMMKITCTLNRTVCLRPCRRYFPGVVGTVMCLQLEREVLTCCANNRLGDCLCGWVVHMPDWSE